MLPLNGKGARNGGQPRSRMASGAAPGAGDGYEETTEEIVCGASFDKYCNTCDYARRLGCRRVLLTLFIDS